jgi:hypothetical protein
MKPKLRLFILLLPVLCIVIALFISNTPPDNKYETSKQTILLRKMVHELLWSSGDSTSTILPVKKIDAFEYRLLPEKPLPLSPDSFVAIINQNIKEYKLSTPFTASVVRKKNNETVYAFAASLKPAEQTLACQGRILPEDDYYIRFVFAPATTAAWKQYAWWCGAILSLGGTAIWLKKKKVAVVLPSPNNYNNNSLAEGQLTIGRYYFKPYQQLLQLDDTIIPLTGKESRVLHLLAIQPNTLVQKEVLKKEVWEDEGVLISRSLDMFISKLRKKLSNDPAVKIGNVHGQGYRLEVQG